MADIALTETTVTEKRIAAVRRGGFSDARFHGLTMLAAFIVLAIFCGVLLSLGIGAMPAIKTFGLPFVYTEAWNPVTEKFGALASVYGSLVTSAIAMLIAVPVGIGIAIFLTEICPRSLRRSIGSRHRAAWRASPASSTASGACSYSRRFPDRPCSPG